MFLIIRHLSRNLYLSVVLIAVCFEIRLFRHKISKMSCANTQIWNAEEEEEEQESSAYHKKNPLNRRIIKYKTKEYWSL